MTASQEIGWDNDTMFNVHRPKYNFNKRTCAETKYANAYYTDKVCTAAYHLYRERFLARKYGSHLISDKVGALPEPAYEALLEAPIESDEDGRKESASVTSDKTD